MDRKERIEKILENNKYRIGSLVVKLENLIQEEVDVYEDIFKYIVKEEPHGDECTELAQQALKGKKPDPSKADLIELVKEILYCKMNKPQGLLDTYRWNDCNRRLIEINTKLEGE